MRKIAVLLWVTLLAGCGGGGGGGSATYSGPAPTLSFYVYNFGTMQRYSISTERVAEGTHCYIYAESGWIDNSDLATISALASGLANEFDTSIYPNIVAGFGSEPNPGVDGYAKIFIVLLDIQDGLTDGSYVAGYFDSLNEIPNMVGSNAKEVFFMDIDPGNPASPTFRKSLAHEFQHMVHWNQKEDDDTWLDEAMSEVAPYYAGYGANYSRVFTFEDGNNRSDSLTNWDFGLKDYSVVYMWAQYMEDRFHDDDPLLFKNILANPFTGIDSVEYYLGSNHPGTTFSSVFRDWSIAVFSGNTIAWAGHPEWSYRTIDTWPGMHNGWLLDGLITSSNRNIADLPAMAEWSIDLYWYTSSSDNSALTWSTGGSPEPRASFYDWDTGGDMTFDMSAGSPYPYDNAAVLVLQNPGGNITASTTTTNPVLADPPPAVASPALKLKAIAQSGTSRRLREATGEPVPVCVQDILSRRAKTVRQQIKEKRNAP